MNAPLKFLAAALCGLLLGLPAAHAEDYFPISDVYIQLGAEGDPMVIEPAEVTLRVGEVYRFVVTNPSDITHIVAAPEFRQTVVTTELLKWTPTLDYPALVLSAGISLHSGEMMEWTFVALEEGKFKFGCDDPVHAAAGMHTIVNVVS